MHPSKLYELAKCDDFMQLEEACRHEYAIIDGVYSASPGIVGAPVYYLALEGCFDGVERLLRLGASIDLAVMGAAQGGYVEVVMRYIHQNGASEEKAINGAARGGHLELLSQLEMRAKAACPDGDISYNLAAGGHRGAVLERIKKNTKCLEYALNGAAYGGHFGLLAELKSLSGALSSPFIAFHLALGGHEEVVFNSIKQSEKHLYAARAGAARAGNLLLLSKLNALGGNSYDPLRVMYWLAVSGHAEAVWSSINETSLSSRSKLANTAAEGAASAGHFKLLEALERRFSSELSLSDIICSLAATGREDVVLRYINEKGAPIKRAAEGAAIASQYDLLEKLVSLYGSSIDLIDTLMAVNSDKNSNDDVILYYIRNKKISAEEAARQAVFYERLQLASQIKQLFHVELDISDIVYELALGGREERVMFYINNKRDLLQKAAEGAAMGGHVALLDKIEIQAAHKLDTSRIIFCLAAGGHEEATLEYIKTRKVSIDVAVNGATFGKQPRLLSVLASMAAENPKGSQKMHDDLLAEEATSKKSTQSKSNNASKKEAATTTTKESDPWEKYWKKLVQLNSKKLDDNLISNYPVFQVDRGQRNAAHRFFAMPRNTKDFNEPLTPLFLVVYYYFRLVVTGDRHSAKLREKLLADMSQMIEGTHQESCYGVVGLKTNTPGINQGYSVLFLLLDMVTFHHQRIAASVKKHTLRVLERMPEAIWQQLFFRQDLSTPLDNPLRMITALFRNDAHSRDFTNTAIKIAVERAPLSAWVECPTSSAGSDWICSPLTILLNALYNRIQSGQEGAVDLALTLINVLRSRGILEPQNTEVMALTFAYRDEHGAIIPWGSVQEMLSDLDEMLAGHGFNSDRSFMAGALANA